MGRLKYEHEDLFASFPMICASEWKMMISFHWSVHYKPIGITQCFLVTANVHLKRLGFTGLKVSLMMIVKLQDFDVPYINVVKC